MSSDNDEHEYKWFFRSDYAEYECEIWYLMSEYSLRPGIHLSVIHGLRQPPCLYPCQCRIERVGKRLRIILSLLRLRQ